MRKLFNLIKKTVASLKANGVGTTAKKIRQFLAARRTKNRMAAQYYEPCMDVLFINGCSRELVPHPPRYRISHQMEQLMANNIVSNEVNYEALSLESGDAGGGGVHRAGQEAAQDGFVRY